MFKYLSTERLLIVVVSEEEKTPNIDVIPKTLHYSVNRVHPELHVC